MPAPARYATPASHRIGGREILSGGRGFLLGDDGSAARIGADAARAALRACDSLGPSTPLTDSLMQHFDETTRMSRCKWALTAKKPSDWRLCAGRCSPPRVKATPSAGRSSEAAAAALALANLTRMRFEAARRRSHVALVGGLSEGIRPHLAADLDSALRRPLFDATDGAILLAGGFLPASPDKSEGS